MAATHDTAEMMKVLTIGAERPDPPVRHGLKPGKEYRKHPPSSGFAKVVYPNGDMFEGTFEDHLRSGKDGSLTQADGRRYRGSWRDDKPHGQGEEITATRTSYKGQYEHGCWHGKGREVTVLGDEYNGEWEKGLRHGSGDYFADGLHYVGEWVKGKRHGRGRCTFRNGDVYDGEFEGDVMHGEGFMLLSSGSRYEGEWHKGVMHGRGTMLFPNGDEYTGEWRSGKREGKGAYASRVSGSVYEGEFAKGRRHGRGRQQSVAPAPSAHQTRGAMPFRVVRGECYDGEWRGGRRSGAGEVTLGGRVVYAGAFVNDLRDGHGEATFRSGARYVGLWREGRMHGEGVLTTAGGGARERRVVRGVWELGQCVRVMGEGEGAGAGAGAAPGAGSGGGATMEHFERGRERVLLHSGGLALGATAGGSGRHGEDEEAEEASRTVGLMFDLQEVADEAGEEAGGGAPRGELDGDSHASSAGGAGAPHATWGAPGHSRGSSRGARGETEGGQTRGAAAGGTLPGVRGVSARAAPGAGALLHAAAHDEMVGLAARHGVEMRGAWDAAGNYVPPVTSATLREWTAANQAFEAGRERKAQVRAAGGSATAFSFDGPYRPGYGEGATAKQAKLHLPRRTDTLRAGPGEFSAKRWRKERLAAHR